MARGRNDSHRHIGNLETLQIKGHPRNGSRRTYPGSSRSGKHSPVLDPEGDGLCYDWISLRHPFGTTTSFAPSWIGGCGFNCLCHFASRCRPGFLQRSPGNLAIHPDWSTNRRKVDVLAPAGTTSENSHAVLSSIRFSFATL